MKIVWAALVSLFAAPAAVAQSPRFAAVPYGDGHPRQVLDVHVPAGPIIQNRPLVIWIHGGGWQGGSRASATSNGKVTELLARGFVVASLDYRLSQDAVFPAQIHDCKAAIRHLRQRATVYGVDPGRFGVWGSSAGGHLAALVGTSGGVAAAEGSVGAGLGNTGFSSRVHAVSDFFGPSDFLGIPSQSACNSPESLLLGACLRDIQANITNPDWADEVAIATLAGPISHVSADDPEFHIAHGAIDGTVPVAHSERLHAALLGAGVASTLRIVPGAGHWLPLSEYTPVYTFFQRILGRCPADLDNGTNTGTPDGGVGIEDLLYYLAIYDLGITAADVDDGSGVGTPDGGVGIEDILYYLARYDAGC